VYNFASRRDTPERAAGCAGSHTEPRPPAQVRPGGMEGKVEGGTFSKLLRLTFRPGQLATTACECNGNIAVAVGAFSWPVLLVAPLIGGGLDEPYSSWAMYMRATWDGWAYGVLVLPVTLMITACVSMLERRARGLPAARCRALLLAAVPLLLPMLAFVPFHVVAAARDQMTVPPPAFADWGGWRLFGSVHWLWVFFLGWCGTVLWADFRLTRMDWENHCLRCGYSREGLGNEICPECGSRC
jgi:hypothetical protein